MIGCGDDASSSSFAKTICSICYEDLKPIVEDLQSISICGHVFHELCIQQWFEYCSNGKKKCPVCKQTCSASNVIRLYFQSVGDSNEPKISQKPQAHGEDPEELHLEIRRLEGKVKGLNSALDSQQNDIKNVTEELFLCKEQLEKAAALKNEALEQARTVKRLLNLKSEELNTSSLACIRLQERNMALAKELAALKLVSDLNLDEEEVLKLASLGTEANNKETTDVLKKSLVMRNKMYKELIVKCNTLGRDEARSRKKLERAKEKMQKLKTRIQELETASEIKENEDLRALKASMKTNISASVVPSLIDMSMPEEKIKDPAVSEAASDQVASMSAGPFCPRKTKRLRGSENIGTTHNKDGTSAPGQGISSYILIDDDSPEISRLHEFPSIDSVPQFSKGATNNASCLSSPGKESRRMHKMSKNDGDVQLACADEDISLVHETAKNNPLPDIMKENSLPVFNSQKGDICFSGGLLGPDGTNWHLGKWCKRAQSKGFKASSVPTQGSGGSTGDLIAVGADGRGGRIKVLKSKNSSSSDYKETSTCPRNGKFGSRTTSLQSQGCLQIDHFFRKASQ